MNNTTCNLTKLFIPTLFILFSTPLAASASSDESCLDRVRSNCLDCHQETRICQKIRKNKNTGAWKKTIKSMVRNGAQVSKDDHKLLADCLSAPDAGIRELCPKK